MEKNILKINITGHRPGKLYGYDIHRPEYNDIRNQIKGSLMMLIKKYAAEEVICYSGMALGTDQIFIECCIEAREYYKKHGKFMVEKTDCTIAVWNGSPSGTADCIKDAERLGHEVVIINP